MAHKRRTQLALPMPSGWGGHRKGAGRRPKPGRSSMTHDLRPQHDARNPVQITMRATNVPSLRSAPIFTAVRTAIAGASRSEFRVVHLSVQQDHLRLIVEADDRVALQNGVRGLAIRTALAVNRARRRRAPVFVDRYHARALVSPREVRASLVYVLLNFRKHLGASSGIDPCSSGPWFDGWTTTPVLRAERPPVVPARTWLGSVGWRKGGGPIDLREGAWRSNRPVSRS